MTKKELFLKTVFCCIACDGDIAEEEVGMVRELCANDKLFSDMDAEKYINAWIAEINERGSMFLKRSNCCWYRLHSTLLTQIIA